MRRLVPILPDAEIDTSREAVEAMFARLEQTRFVLGSDLAELRALLSERDAQAKGIAALHEQTTHLHEVVADARRAAFEEAAKIAEQARYMSYSPHDHPENIANRIRAKAAEPELGLLTQGADRG